MPGIRVVTDSSSDLPPELIDKYGIHIVPLTVRFGSEEFVDLRDLTPDEFWDRCRTSPTLPETAAPSPGAFLEAYRKAADEGMDGVVCVTISSGLSATFQAANTAAQDPGVPLGVGLVDSRYVSLAHGFVALAAAEAAADGASLEEATLAARSSVARTYALATVDSLENLRKGGRIGGAQALLGSMLSIKPVIHLVDGLVEPESKQRTRSKALAHLIERVRAKGAPELIGVAHGDARDLDPFLEKVREAFPGVEVVVGQMGAVLGTHTGQGTIILVARRRG